MYLFSGAHGLRQFTAFDFISAVFTAFGSARRNAKPLKFGKLFIAFITEFGISFRGDEEFFGLLGVP